MSKDNKNLPVALNAGDVALGEARADYVTLIIAGQMFGIPVLQVQDVIQHANITRIPLAPQEIAGSLNLRGRIVTAIDVRTRLGLAGREVGKRPMHVVVDFKHELYSLMVDSVGEVLSLPQEQFEVSPPTLEQRWRDVAAGIFRLPGELLVVLDISRLLSFAHIEAA